MRFKGVFVFAIGMIACSENVYSSDDITAMLNKIFDSNFREEGSMRAEASTLKIDEVKTITKIHCLNLLAKKSCKRYRTRIRRVECPQAPSPEAVCFVIEKTEVQCGIFSYCEIDSIWRGIYIDPEGRACWVYEPHDFDKTGCYEGACVRPQSDRPDEYCHIKMCLDSSVDVQCSPLVEREMQSPIMMAD